MGTRKTGAHALATLLLAAPLLAGSPPESARAQTDTCEYRYDGECDEGYGTGLCAEGTDSWDCRRAGTPPGPESCIYSRDGECDEPAGTGVCIPYTDTADCRAAGIDQSRVFFGHDDRVWPDSTELPWRMIGRIAFESGGSCTGSLIGPSTVLTAAHCMFGGEGPRGIDRPLTFLAGADGPKSVAKAGIIDFYVPPQFDIQLHTETSEVDGYDWAILVLDAPIGQRLGWFRVEALDEAWLTREVDRGTLFVKQGGYSGDSMAFLSANLSCPVVQVWDDGTIYHQCDTLPGDSGSPLFIDDGDGYRILALESATYPNAEGRYDDNMAVDARAFWQAAQNFWQ
ncbi:MAG: trypsin-like serine protease [Alphaproteobacteria bacterium]